MPRTKNKYCSDCGKLIYNTSTKCASCAQKGRKAPWVTKRNLEDNPSKRPEVKKKMSETRKRLIKEGKIKLSSTCFKKNDSRITGKNNFWYGKKRPDNIERNKAMIGIKKGPLSEEQKIKISKSLKKAVLEGRLIPKWGTDNPNWSGGKSFEPYDVRFNEKLKEKIRKAYHYRCQQCFRHQDELKRKLAIHHIDFNKKNNEPSNLIPLCVVCHSQTNFNRANWTDYFKDKVVL